MMAAIDPSRPAMTASAPKGFSSACLTKRITSARNRGASLHSGPHPLASDRCGWTVSSQCFSFQRFHQPMVSPLFGSHSNGTHLMHRHSTMAVQASQRIPYKPRIDTLYVLVRAGAERLVSQIYGQFKEFIALFAVHRRSVTDGCVHFHSKFPTSYLYVAG